jgi:phospholipid N-methyltransferase
MALPNIFGTYWRFLLAGLFNQGQTGGVVPSQRFLVSKMLLPIPSGYSGRIVELGAGTGALTLRLAAKCPAARILACEINGSLAQDLQYSLISSGLGHRTQVVSDSAQHLLASITHNSDPPPDFILSGIPLGNMGRDGVLELLGMIRSVLAPGGMYIQFQHSLLDRRKIRKRFSRLRTIPVFLNFPPAVVYYAQK